MIFRNEYRLFSEFIMILMIIPKTLLLVDSLTKFLKYLSVEAILLKVFWLICGILALTLGVIAIALPLLPTTPFILLAAALFAKSSKTFHDRLVSNKYFGPIIMNWQENRTVPPRAIFVAVLLMSISIGLSLLFLINYK